jgi:hypothetical protein
MAFSVLLLVPVLCQADEIDVRHDISFPNLPGYQMLACDLHMHTVFSDGEVWPTVRVRETWRQGLHALAISDHIEYLPHAKDVSTLLNRPYELTEEIAAKHGMLLVRAAEITRDSPPGHFNAIFLNDVKPLEVPDFLEAIKQANLQGAFVFWNHQGWKGEERGAWLEDHTTLLNNKWLHGMEVANGGSYFPTAHRWCLEKGLTMLGNTDIHKPDLRCESRSDDHRTMTLVFAKDASLACLKEALQAKRTIVWFKDQLIGREDILCPFFAGCVQVGKPTYRNKTEKFVEVRNLCQADIHLETVDNGHSRPIVLPAKSTKLVKVPLSKNSFQCTVKNFLVAPDQGLKVTLTIPGEEQAAKAD